MVRIVLIALLSVALPAQSLAGAVASCHAQAGAADSVPAAHEGHQAHHDEHAGHGDALDDEDCQAECVCVVMCGSAANTAVERQSTDAVWTLLMWQPPETGPPPSADIADWLRPPI